jgi:hypothetical protein
MKLSPRLGDEIDCEEHAYTAMHSAKKAKNNGFLSHAHAEMYEVLRLTTYEDLHPHFLCDPLLVRRVPCSRTGDSCLKART